MVEHKTPFPQTKQRTKTRLQTWWGLLACRSCCQLLGTSASVCFNPRHWRHTLAQEFLDAPDLSGQAFHKGRIEHSSSRRSCKQHLRLFECALCQLARSTASHSSCSDGAHVPSHDSRYCLARLVLLPRRPESRKIPAKHPSVLWWFSYPQLTDRCFSIPSLMTSVHRLMVSYLK